MDLTTYDYILVNSSAGKDSQAMLDWVAEIANAQGVFRRLIVVHCDLGRMEWPGTPELAQRQAEAYGIPFEMVRNRNWRDLLERIEARGMWPDAGTRYCTSEFKTGQVKRLATRLVREWREAHPGETRKVRILNCLGIRKQESPARAKRTEFRHLGNGWSNGKRQVDEWLPILEWSLDDVWERIHASGVEYHYAYDLGMPRVSCVLCPFGSQSGLQVGAEHNPELAEAYVAAEERMGHKFTARKSLLEILTAPGCGGPVEAWCA